MTQDKVSSASLRHTETQNESSGGGKSLAAAQGTILTEAAARWLYGRVPFREVGSTAAEQVMKAVM